MIQFVVFNDENVAEIIEVVENDITGLVNIVKVFLDNTIPCFICFR
jgi:hypothetical protein